VTQELNHETVLLVSRELKMRLALVADAGADPQRLGKAGAFADAILRGVRDVLAVGADRTAANTRALAAMDEGAKGGYTQAPGEVLERHLLTAAAFREEEKRKEDQRVAQSKQTLCLQMLEAAEEGQADVCAELLRQGCSVNFAPRSGATALHRASANGHLSTVTLLIDAKADVTALDTAGASAFDKAFVRRKRDVLSALVQQGRGAQDAEVQLLLSIRDSNTAAVQLLLDVAPDAINTVDARLETPLHISVANCYQQLVGLLLERGADVNGGVPNAEESGDGRGEVDGGAGGGGGERDGAGAGTLEGEGNGGGGGVEGVDAKTLQGGIMGTRTDEAAVEGGGKGVGFDERKTPLMLAVEKDHAKILQMLLDAGADVGRRGAVSGMTALHTACALGSESAVDMLLAALLRRKDKMVLGISDAAGNNAVHTSVLGGNLEILQKVLVCCKGGGDEINALNKDGVSPVYLACQGSSGGGTDEALAKALINRGADKSVARGEFPEFSFLEGPNVEVEDVDVDLESAAVKIQSLARGKRDRERVKNLKGLDGEGEGGGKEGAAEGGEVKDGLQAQILEKLEYQKFCKVHVLGH
jgi:ankyrin repeat protein